MVHTPTAAGHTLPVRTGCGSRVKIRQESHSG